MPTCLTCFHTVKIFHHNFHFLHFLHFHHLLAAVVVLFVLVQARSMNNTERTPALVDDHVDDLSLLPLLVLQLSSLSLLSVDMVRASAVGHE